MTSHRERAIGKAMSIKRSIVRRATRCGRMGQVWVGKRLRSPMRHPRNRAAIKWRQAARPPEGDDEESLELSKQLFEYGLKVLDERVEAQVKGVERALILLRLNAYLSAGFLAFLNAKEIDIGWLAYLAIASWTTAIILLAFACRRFERPSLPSVNNAYELLSGKNKKQLHAWLTLPLHEAIVQMEVILEREATLINTSLGFTIAGLIFLLAATALA